LYWVSYFGLKTWAIDFEHKKLVRSDANISYDTITRNATARLNTNMSRKGLELIKACAFHEVCELLFAELIVLAEGRSSSLEDINVVKHNLIAIFENTVFLDRGKIENNNKSKAR